MISANELETFLNNCQFYFSKWWPCNFQSCHDHPLEKNCQIKVASKCKFLSMYYLPYLGYQNSTTYFPRVNFHKKGNKKSVIFFSPSFFILFYLVKKRAKSKERAPRIFNKRAPDESSSSFLSSKQPLWYLSCHSEVENNKNI